MVGHCAVCAIVRVWVTLYWRMLSTRRSRLDDDCRRGFQFRPGRSTNRLGKSVADITEVSGFELKQIMRTGTVATDNRNWELRDNSGPVHRLSQSRAVALDMESATIAANGIGFAYPMERCYV